MQLHRRQLSPLVGEHEVQQRQAALLHVVGGSAVAQPAHHLHRRLQLLRRDEQIDVAGQTPAGIAVDRLAQQRALQRRRSGSPRRRASRYAQRDRAAGRRPAGAPPRSPAPPPRRSHRSREPPASSRIRGPRMVQQPAQAQRLGESLASPPRHQPPGPLAHRPPAGGRARAEQDELPFGSEAGHRSSERHSSRWSPALRSAARTAYEVPCSSIFSSCRSLQGKEARICWAICLRSSRARRCTVRSRSGSDPAP